MSLGLSLYLDLLRCIAALIVLLSHLGLQRITGGFLWQLTNVGHAAVVIFFVLSGFVISHTTATKDKDFSSYIVSRLSRLYSVVIPAIILTLILDTAGVHLSGGGPYDLERETYPLLRAGFAAVFLSESWYNPFASLLSNKPFWSLPYEFWYYVLFGALFYFRSSTRVWLTLLAAVVAGPNILLMMPIWLLGVLVYHVVR